MNSIKPNERLDIREILKDLENYRPNKRGWIWRDVAPQKIGEFMLGSQIKKGSIISNV